MDWCLRQAGESRVDQCLRILCAALVLWFPAACLVVDRSDSVTLLLLAGVGLSLWIRNGFRAGFTRSDWLFVAVFAGFFMAGILAFELGYQTDEGFRLLGRYLRFLFALPVLLALRRYPPPAPVVWGSLVLAALVLGLDAVWESAAAGGFLRPDGDTNVAILFGDLATLTTFTLAAGYVYIDTRLARTGPWLVAACVLMGLLASFLSGTRGAWLAMPVLLALFLFCRHLLRPRTVLMGGVGVVILFAMLAYLPGIYLMQRVKVTMLQAESYMMATRDEGSHAAFPACLDDGGLLAAWIRKAASNDPDGFGARVDQLEGPDASALLAQGCSRGSAIHIENKGTEPAWLVLPRYQPSGVDPVVARLLVKGEGSIGYQGQGAQREDAPGFMPVTLTGPAGSGGQISLGLYPGQALWFVPIESYFGEYHYPVMDTPIGKRLEMWRAALHLFAEAPVFGVGLGAYQTETGKLVAAGLAAPGSAEYDHPHSDFFDALANRGLVGFLALVALLAVPAWLFARRLGSRDPHALGAALSGLLVAVGYAVFGLTETLFIHSVTIGWYVIMTTVFFVSSAAPAGQDKDR